MMYNQSYVPQFTVQCMRWNGAGGGGWAQVRQVLRPPRRRMQSSGERCCGPKAGYWKNGKDLATNYMRKRTKRFPDF